jgi:3-oxo-5alpha-steroid 4-dehydrogenase
VIYVGGGTSVQKAAGYEDTPEAMFAYLSREVDGVVFDETLQRFCESGPEMIRWLERHGVRFKAAAYAKKTSYPTSKYYLYFSDNSLLEKNRNKHPPAPRGHKVYLDLGERASFGFGRGIIDPLRAAATSVRLLYQTDARQLVVDRKGAVIGLKAYQTTADHPRYKALIKAQRSMHRWQLMLPPSMPGARITGAIGGYYARVASEIERMAARPLYVRVKRGICLSCGGFIFNRPMVRALAPLNVKSMPLGTPADDGSGMLLGYSVAGALNRMDEVSNWRFLNPPRAWARGVLVNARGERFVDEASYGATIGRAMMKPGNEGVAWLILDHELWQFTQENLKQDDLLPFQRDPVRLTMWLYSKKAGTLKGLAAKIDVNPDRFVATIEQYRKAQAGEIVDIFNKSSNDMGWMQKAPYYALDMGVASRFFPLPSITLGGLLVDERTGLVLRSDRTTIPGLYAAGRTAVGLCSNLYLSGLASADCIFSGRRAASHAVSLKDGPEESRIGLSAAAASRNFVPAP